MRIVTAAVIRDGTRVLLARRGPGETLAGMWEFPGGKVEEGETLQICLARELHEELGLKVRVGDVIAESVYEYAHGCIKLVALDVTITGGELTLLVHDKTAWVGVGQLESFALAPADIPIAAQVKSHVLGNLTTPVRNPVVNP